MDTIGLPDIWGKAVLGMLLIGFLPVLIFSWVYEMTPEGLKRETDIAPGASVRVFCGNVSYVAIARWAALLQVLRFGPLRER